MTMRLVLVVGLLISLCCGSAVAMPALTVLPPSVAQGGPGQSVGWGFSFTNDTLFFLAVDSSVFCGPGGDPTFTDCTTPFNGTTQFGPSLGTYTDFIASNMTVIPPLTTVMEPFDAMLMTGVGEYTISPSAPFGATDTIDSMGNITSNLFVSYQEFMGGPPGVGTQVSGDIFVSAPAAVQVIPEPATWTLVGVVLLLWCTVRWRWKPREFIASPQAAPGRASVRGAGFSLPGRDSSRPLLNGQEASARVPARQARVPAPRRKLSPQ